MTYDVLVIGGGPAGLTAALTLGRVRRSVLVLDSGEPRNAPAAGVHGFPTRDGLPPAELVALTRAEAEVYGVRVERARVVGARRAADGFEVTTAAGETFAARRLLVATGLADDLPDVPGVRELWGRDVVHCPFCHGWEIRDTAIGVLGTGPMAVHQALLFRRMSADLTLFTHRSDPPTAEQREQLDALGVTVVPGEVAGLVLRDDRLVGVRLTTGEVVPRTALAVAPVMGTRADFLTDLGLPVEPHPMGSHVPADARGRAADGVWLAGNATDPAASVLIAAAEGATAAVAIHADLLEEDTRRAVEHHRRALAG
ncbi:NAD(P)/FAD-dependent oxidoreductase [Actinosynnema sp. NPDC020468]|uniref:NAD(P)/FAD-dependent oxidoreductase n=1 Tax=Actinosynnema sp. NPDC020468 TaxID=3154488 RepID=UPI0033CABC54